MSIKHKKKHKTWMSNLYQIGTLLTLFFIMAQVFLARRSMIQSNEWEKAKVTIENIEHFKEKLKEVELYGKTEVLIFADRTWPDFTTPEGWKASEPLRKLYGSFFEEDFKRREDVEKSLAILNAFAYPIIMGYASEFGSYQSVSLEFNTYNNFVMPIVFDGYKKIGHHAKLLHRSWRVRHEQEIVKNSDFNDNSIIAEINANKNNLLCFEGAEITPASFKQYGKKLERELKKIQKEIEVFRKSSMK